ncbi:MAG TPA: glycosyltransferase family 2 protein, partial [Thermoanaerobaculia bacterium]|nr:glycosyltransferase family 2 protein [Thermoanaerobaculia bacterium]
MRRSDRASAADSSGATRQRPLVTVYVPCHAYGHFLQQAIDSVLGQLLTSWELILIDDASSDDTAKICAACRDLHPERVRVIRNESAAGLAHNANVATSMARGKYLMRLDADDWLDEAALLVLSRYLDDHPQVALVYPNYFYVDAKGRFLGVEHRKRIGPEAGLLDLPAHGACTMVRKRVMRAIGGYDEQHKAQDGYDLWLKVLHRYPVANVETPLFYYRQHSSSLSRDSERLLDARQRIKRSFLEQRKGAVRLQTVAVVPAKNTYTHMTDVVLAPLAGRPLIDWTLDAALGCEQVDEIVVSTDDERVAA